MNADHGLCQLRPQRLHTFFINKHNSHKQTDTDWFCFTAPLRHKHALLKHPQLLFLSTPLFMYNPLLAIYLQSLEVRPKNFECYTIEQLAKDVHKLFALGWASSTLMDKLDPANRVLVAPVKARIQISWLVFPSALVMQIFAEARNTVTDVAALGFATLSSFVNFAMRHDHYHQRAKRNILISAQNVHMTKMEGKNFHLRMERHLHECQMNCKV
ncbi:hypothetical protein pdam_00024484 [Pocillopora damicornis]|uniref:Uncharacterized protein n=1 Tax=Pocillopora damicornis TaxID=46731 RepID=A0A3M6TC20_POCDA|nr:hypothetical protein pdam_00024484 [Pocillopora damicornis]